MGSFDGAETCELVGLFLLSELKKLNLNIGLYRDDGLAISDLDPQNTETLKKQICNIFNDNDLSLTIEANKNHVHFLDVTLNLSSGFFKPFMKENNQTVYVNTKSNHPPNILKNIPLSINKRLSNISSNEGIFNVAAPHYQKALNESGYNFNLKYSPEMPDQNSNKSSKTRKRKILWFNPPYNQMVSDNIGRLFLNIIKKCFPPTSKLHKLFNKNNVKISYSCMPNIKRKITQHNKKITSPTPTLKQNVSECNCRKKAECPLQNKCLTKNIIYQAKVSSNQGNGVRNEFYIGLTSTTFKERFGNHKTSFTHSTKRTETTLSQYIWELKDENKDFNLTWKIVAKAEPYNPATKKCNLCIKEKYYIIYKPEMSTLNKRSELTTACRHRKKFLLVNA